MRLLLYPLVMQEQKARECKNKKLVNSDVLSKALTGEGSSGGVGMIVSFGPIAPDKAPRAFRCTVN